MNDGPETVDNGKDVSFYTILFVCTSSRGWSSSSGLWLEVQLNYNNIITTLPSCKELSTPYYEFQSVGYRIDIATLEGGPPPIDSACFHLSNATESTERFLADEIAQECFRKANSLERILSSREINKYGCIFLCGGHGAAEDFPHNDTIKRAVEVVYNVRHAQNRLLPCNDIAQETNGCVAAVCHGPLGLLDCLKQDGKPLLKDKFVAAFSNEEERELGLIEKLKMLTETALEDVGAISVPSPPWRPNAVVDGRLVTGQNPQSSQLVAQRVLDVLRSLGSTFSTPENVNKPWGQ